MCHSAPSSGHAYGCPSESSSLADPECSVAYDTMIPNNYASVGKSALPTPPGAQYHVGFLPAVNGGISALVIR